MKKIMAVCLILVLTTLCTVGYAKENISDIVGYWEENNAGDFVYYNKTMNLKFDVGQWRYYKDAEKYAENAHMSLSAWKKSMQTDLENGEFCEVMMCVSNNKQLFVTIHVADYTENTLFNSSSYENLDLLANMLKNGVESALDNILDIDVETITFMKEKTPCVKVRYIDSNNTECYIVFINVINNGYLARIRIESEKQDKTANVASKFSKIHK